MEKIESIIKRMESYGAKWPMTPREILRYRGIGPVTIKSLQKMGLVFSGPIEEPNEMYGLTTRANECLLRLGIQTKQEAIEAIQSGKLHPKNRSMYNYGWMSHKLVCKWIGLPEPEKITGKKRLCPHCGKNIYASSS